MAERPSAECPPPTFPGDTLRYGALVIDDVVVARGVPFRLAGREPETYSVVGPEPAALAALPVDRIDLVQFISAPESEQYDGCAGTLVMRVITRRPGDIDRAGSGPEEESAAATRAEADAKAVTRSGVDARAAPRQPRPARS